MEIRINEMGIEAASDVLVNLAAIMECSAERGDVPTEMYASAFEVIGALATAIKQQATNAA